MWYGSTGSVEGGRGASEAKRRHGRYDGRSQEVLRVSCDVMGIKILLFELTNVYNVAGF